MVNRNFLTLNQLLDRFRPKTNTVNRALEDDALTARLAAMGMPLTVCPLSNLKLRALHEALDLARDDFILLVDGM